MKSHLILGVLAVLVVTVAVAAADGGGRGARLSFPTRVPVQWRELDLRTGSGEAGEAVTVLSVEERIRELVQRSDDEKQPSLVWLCKPSDQQIVKRINESILAFEYYVLPLTRLHCYRVDLEALPDDDLTSTYLERAQAFWFFDPAGKVVKRLETKRATSPSSFRDATILTWARSFTMLLRDFRIRSRAALDQREKLEKERARLEAVREDLKATPNREQVKELARDLAQLGQALRDVAKEEQSIRAECTVLPEFSQ